MTATDELRRLLTEAGVEWKAPESYDGSFEHDTIVGDYWFHEYDGKITVHGLTPEQAIAATLGDGEYERKMDELLCRLTGGRWSKTREYDLDFMESMVREEFETEQAIAATLGPTITGETSDGYHTFNELYHHRAVLFSVVVRDHVDLAWKSRLHHDGTMYDGMFIVGIETPSGQATYHYDLDPYWDMFECREIDRAPVWDGHTPDDAIARIATLGAGTCRLKRAQWDNGTCTWGCICTACDAHLEHETGIGYNYCPNCGRKVVDE